MADGGRDAERSKLHSLRTFCQSPPFYHRVILLLIAIAVSAPVMYKSRPGRETATQAAFSVSTSPRGYVRISGDVRHAGIYPISVNTMTITAIKMADPLSAAMDGLQKADAAAYLENGMQLQVTVRPNGALLLTKRSMSSSDRLVMGIPLDINAMSEADFDKLPGIGPKLAKKIVVYRQNNGGEMAVTDLTSIEGIGEKKYKQLLKYF